MKCDIIIPVWNQFEFTRDCLESVFKNTNFPFSLIIIDNASNEPTKSYLEKLSQEKKDTVILLKNEKNLGFVKAINQGIRASTAEYLCLLNNDTEVTSAWLAEMVKVAQLRPDIGIVNANSNTLGTHPKKAQTIDALAKELKSLSGTYSELAWASGFCMLIKRKVIQEVGLFDEIYGMGNFEDADFSKRAQGLGYFCVCAKAAYVYHRERRSFIKMKRFDHDFQRNRRIFFAKWGTKERILYVLSKEDPEHIGKVAQEALRLARDGNTVWILFKGTAQENIKRHSNIYVYGLSRVLFNLRSLWRILKRKKKFDKIYVDDENYGRRLNSLQILHKAEVIYTPRPS